MLSIAFISRKITTSLLTLGVISFPLASLAVNVEAVPNPRKVNSGWVTDMANILSQPTESQINQLVSQLSAKNGAEIAVVTVPDTKPSATPKEFATALFNRWHIGKKGKDNGVLLLISKGERRVEIETGYGVEAILPDAKVGDIIRQQITPHFKQADYDGGTLAGTKALVNTLSNEQISANVVAEEPADNSDVLWLYGLGGGLALAVGTGVYLKKRRQFIPPEGKSREPEFGSGSSPMYCQQCHNQMEKLDQTALQPYLSQPEQVAQQLGSVKYEGWQCSHCRPQLTGTGIHIRAYILNSSRYTRWNTYTTCPTCQELTAERTQQILQDATEYSEGRQQIHHHCHCCDYDSLQEKIIPRIVRSTTTSSSSSNSYSSNSSPSSSYSSDSSSSSGSDFGGGSSGGGGSGDSW
ncbi:MAG: TPM domain-containing protein [Crinalium sp.]